MQNGYNTSPMRIYKLIESMKACTTRWHQEVPQAVKPGALFSAFNANSTKYVSSHLHQAYCGIQMYLNHYRSAVKAEIVNIYFEVIKWYH